MEKNKQIPKKIHYCWFGGKPLPELTQKCIESWKQYASDYEIIEWNEKNFDITYCDYVKEAYEAKKWAFVSDVARLFALVNHGGIYMDTDVELIKPIDDLMKHNAVAGFETEKDVATCLMACHKEHPLFVELLSDYKGAHFKLSEGEYDYTTNVVRMTNKCLQYGMKMNNSKQAVADFVLYPKDYFCPKDFDTQELLITQNTRAIHHFDSSWYSDIDKYAILKRRKYGKFLPKKLASRMAYFMAIRKYKGLKFALKEALKRLKLKK